MIKVDMGGVMVNALVDTGCTTTIVKEHLAQNYEGDRHQVQMTAFDGRQVRCYGTCRIRLKVAGSPVEVDAVVFKEVVEGIDVVMGNNFIDRLRA